LFGQEHNDTSHALGRRTARHTPLASLIADAAASGRFFYSFEFSAARDPRPEDLYARVERMAQDLRPLWVDVTWGFGDIGAKSIAAARHIQKHTGLPVLMHLICTDMTVADLDAALDAALLAGVRAILVMRGYTQAGFDTWQACEDGLPHADALVTHIRQRHGSHFSLGVVAFPETHPESRCNGPTSVATDADRAEDVRRLRGKVDAGADFVICQFTFDPATWTRFLRQCRQAGIHVPILPGVQPLTEYASARLLSKAWAVQLPKPIGARLRDFAYADDADGARECGRDFVAALCDAQLRRRVESGEGCGLHFFVYDGEHDVRCLLDTLAQRYGWVQGDKAPAPPPLKKLQQDASIEDER